MAFGPQNLRLRRPLLNPGALFGIGSRWPENVMSDMIRRNYLRSLKSKNSGMRDGASLEMDKDKFQVHINVKYFGPEELSVKTHDGYIIIEGQHEEKEDDRGFISRQFTRRYKIPDLYNAEGTESTISSDGVLTITVPTAEPLECNKKSVPIKRTGAVRRKLPATKDIDESLLDADVGTENEGGNADHGTGPPEKKTKG